MDRIIVNYPSSFSVRMLGMLVVAMTFLTGTPEASHHAIADPVQIGRIHQDPSSRIKSYELTTLATSYIPIVPQIQLEHFDIIVPDPPLTDNILFLRTSSFVSTWPRSHLG